MNELKFIIAVVIAFLTVELDAQIFGPNIRKVNLAYLELCDGKAHVYVNIPRSVFTINTNVIITPSWSTISYPMKISENGYELELFNVPVQENQITFQIISSTATSSQIHSETYTHTKLENEIINVTPHLDSLLADHQKNSKSVSITTYFCGKNISTIELLAFFQKFLKLTKEETCALLLKYNYMTMMESLNKISFLDRYKLCQLFEEFLLSRGGGDECLCNVITTNRAAYFYDDNFSGSNNEDGCTDSGPIVKCENFEIFNDDDLIVSQGRLGAAKAVTMVLQYDNCDNSPAPFEYRTKAAGAAIAYRSVCYDPLTLSGNLTNCTGCVKTIDLEYSYQSASRVVGRAVNNVFCEDESFELTGEDWATLIVTQGSSATVEEANSQKHNVTCDVTSPKLQSTITNTGNIINDITTLVSGTISVTAIADAAVKLVDFLETNVFVTPCSTVKIEHYPLIGGTKSYNLEPGGYFQAAILSGATVAGEARKQAWGFIQLNSDFHMAAAVRTSVDITGGVPSYCTCEKIGSYVLGSLMDESAPSNCGFKDDTPVFEMNTVFQYDGRSNQMLQNLAGVFLGLHGPWDPKWTNNGGCCTTVDLNCLAECAYITEPCPTVPRSKSISKLLSSQILISPNPVSNVLTVTLPSELNISRINILTVSGGLIMSLNGSCDPSLQINLDQLKCGMYLLSIEESNGTIHTKKFVKQ